MVPEGQCPNFLPTSTAIIIRLWLTLKRSSSTWILSSSITTKILDPLNWNIPISSPLRPSVPAVRSGPCILSRTYGSHSTVIRTEINCSTLFVAASFPLQWHYIIFMAFDFSMFTRNHTDCFYVLLFNEYALLGGIHSWSMGGDASQVDGMLRVLRNQTWFLTHNSVYSEAGFPFLFFISFFKCMVLLGAELNLDHFFGVTCKQLGAWALAITKVHTL